MAYSEREREFTSAKNGNALQEIEPQAKKMGIVQLYRRAQNEDRLY